MEWTGPYPVEQDRKRYADDITLQDLVRLRVENDFFRRGFELILSHPVDKTEMWQTAVEEMKSIARAALKINP